MAMRRCSIELKKTLRLNQHSSIDTKLVDLPQD